MTASCKTCRFWRGSEGWNGAKGYCHRRAPSTSGRSGREKDPYSPDGWRLTSYTVTAFPSTDPDEWCGEYEEKSHG